jgi:hypothetical protein
MTLQDQYWIHATGPQCFREHPPVVEAGAAPLRPRGRRPDPGDEVKQSLQNSNRKSKNRDQIREFGVVTELEIRGNKFRRMGDSGASSHH